MKEHCVLPKTRSRTMKKFETWSSLSPRGVFGVCLRSLMSALTLVLGVSTSVVVAQEPDNAQLCSAASLTDSYRTNFLKSFTRLQQGDNGWLYRDQDLRTSFGPGEKQYKHLGQLQRLLQQQGVTLVVVPIPTRGLVHPEYLGSVDFDRSKAKRAYRQYLYSLRRQNVVVPALERLLDEPADKPMFFARDHHWNHHGARTMARMTAEVIREQSSYKQLESKVYESVWVENQHNEGSYTRAANQLCDAGFRSEPYKIYQTSEVSADLFGSDSNDQSIVLVGTSNSAGKLRLNFSGFLSHYVKSGVLNMAESGGGYDTAIVNYLSSEDFKHSPPKFLVWELPGYYSLNDPKFFATLFRSLGGES